MTHALTEKQSKLLRELKKAGSPRSVYALAKALGRPYNRVLDNVKLLQAQGHIRLSAARVDGRRAIVIHTQPATRPQPELSYSRVWSAPVTGVDDETLIASVLSEPTFDDLLRCCLHYGLPRVRAVFQAMLSANELSPLVQTATGRMLGNIEIGIARAA